MMEWTVACLVLHNLLMDIQDDDSWLGVVATGGDDGDSPEDVASQAVNYREEERRAGQRRRDELKDRFIRETRLTREARR